MKIRRAEKKDLADVARIHVEAWKSVYRGIKILTEHFMRPMEERRDWRKQYKLAGKRLPESSIFLRSEGNDIELSKAVRLFWMNRFYKQISVVRL